MSTDIERSMIGIQQWQIKYHDKQRWLVVWMEFEHPKYKIFTRKTSTGDLVLTPITFCFVFLFQFIPTTQT